ncbi:hypothetical protein Purlil1_12256 [Purpureocillium lilacinum]|uniref:RNase H type-1 domain-containing protein n=1 Tax=Purpureocillium lilacinum TaxID=33203 RepID=A0ABR0BHB6_PURLI|nr:hypothetical protein Purlil1_12256 [Purpureocillium lilacinum]
MVPGHDPPALDPTHKGRAIRNNAPGPANGQVAPYGSAGRPTNLEDNPAERQAPRSGSLDEAHPLVARTKPIRAPVINRAIKLKYQLPRKPFRTRLRRTDELLPRCARPELLPRSFASDQPLQTASKEESAADFRDWLRSVAPRTAIVYSDGSLSQAGAAGYGYAIHVNGLTILDGNGRLGPAEVFDAEAKGALEGLRAALSLHEPERIDVCLDNLAVATCLQGAPSDSSQKEFLEFQTLAAEHGATEIRWIPGHTYIPGNEQADALAKAGTSQPEPADALPTLAYLLEPRRCTTDVLVRATKRAKTSFLLQEGPTASSDEAGTLTDRGGQPGNRKKFRPTAAPLPLLPVFLGVCVLSSTRPGGGCDGTLCPARVNRAALQLLISFEVGLVGANMKDSFVAPGRPADGQQAEQWSAFEPMKCWVVDRLTTSSSAHPVPRLGDLSDLKVAGRKNTLLPLLLKAPKSICKADETMQRETSRNDVKKRTSGCS